MQKEATAVRIHESKMRLGLSFLTPPLLVFMAWGAWLVESPMVVTAFLAALAAFFGYFVLFEIPLWIELSDEGILRTCVLRQRPLAWDELQGITRPRKRGLTAVTERGKQLILIDRKLSDEEIAAVETEAARHDVKTAL